MKQEITSTIQESDKSKEIQCRSCRDWIPGDAIICKTCGEPQEAWGRTTKFLSAVLSSVVAAGSLGIAYLQYADAKVAKNEAAAARTEAGHAYNRGWAKEEGASNAVREIFNSLTPSERKALMGRFTNQFKMPTADLQKQISQNATNPTLQSQFLLRQFIMSGEHSNE